MGGEEGAWESFPQPDADALRSFIDTFEGTLLPPAYFEGLLEHPERGNQDTGK